MKISPLFLAIILGAILAWEFGRGWMSEYNIKPKMQNLAVLPTNIIYHNTGKHGWSFKIWYYEHDGIRCYVSQERFEKKDVEIASSLSCVRKIPGDESHIPGGVQ